MIIPEKQTTTMLRKIYRRARKLLSSSESGENGIVVIDDIEGLSIKFDVQSGVERYRTARFGGEREALEVFLNVLHSEDIVYDVGASIGLYALSASVKVPKGKVIAFEPDPETRERLETNIALNQLTNVEVVSWAASDTEGSVELYSDGADGYAPTLRKQDRQGAPTGVVKIKTRAIDDALERGELPSPDVLKIDIEGAEALCLKGSAKLLKSNSKPRVLFLEVHPQFLSDYDSSTEEIYNQIDRSGYSIEWRKTRKEQEHILCIRR